jgi:ribosome-binding factor A
LDLCSLPAVVFQNPGLNPTSPLRLLHWARFSDILIRFIKRCGVEKRGAKYHRERLGEALREEIETIVEGELGDPRIGLVSVTSVVLAEDSRSAQVFVTLDGDDNEAQRSMEGLTAAVGYIRREVAENLHLRRPPELYFHLDRSDQYGARIDELLGRTRKRKKKSPSVGH